MTSNVEQPAVDSIVVSYYGDDKNALLRDCLIPLCLSLQRDHGVESTFLERHWMRGPHVRLAVPSGLAFAPDAVAALETIRAYLFLHPSSTRLDPAEYATLSTELGRAELIAPPYAPIRPDNTVGFEPYPVDASVGLIGATGFALKRTFMSAAVAPLGEALDMIASGAHRLVPAFQAMVAHAARWPVGGLATGQISYRSHLEDYLANHDGDGVLREKIVDRFGRVEPVLRQLFRAQVDSTLHGTYVGDDPYLRSWSAAFDRVWPSVLDAAREGKLGEDLGDGYLATARTFDPDVERTWGFGQDRPSSEFHHELAKLNFLPERMHVVDFAAYRFMTNQLTRWLPLIGVPPVERYLASYAVCELVESEFGVTWQTQLESIRLNPTAELSRGNRT